VSPRKRVLLRGGIPEDDYPTFNEWQQAPIEAKINHLFAGDVEVEEQRPPHVARVRAV